MYDSMLNRFWFLSLFELNAVISLAALPSAQTISHLHFGTRCQRLGLCSSYYHRVVSPSEEKCSFIVLLSMLRRTCPPLVTPSHRIRCAQLRPVEHISAMMMSSRTLAFMIPPTPGTSPFPSQKRILQAYSHLQIHSREYVQRLPPPPLEDLRRCLSFLAAPCHQLHSPWSDSTIGT